MIISGTILHNILTVIIYIHFITLVHVIAAHIYHIVHLFVYLVNFSSGTRIPEIYSCDHARRLCFYNAHHALQLPYVTGPGKRDQVGT